MVPVTNIRYIIIFNVCFITSSHLGGHGCFGKELWRHRSSCFRLPAPFLDIRKRFFFTICISGKVFFFWKLFWISGKVLFLGTFSRYPEKCLLSPPFLDISRKGAGKKETFPEIQKRCWKCVFFPAPFLNIRKSVFFQHLFRLLKKGTFSGTCPVYPETCLFSWNFFWNIRKSIVFKIWIYLKCDTWQYMVCSFLNLDIQETNI